MYPTDDSSLPLTRNLRNIRYAKTMHLLKVFGPKLWDLIPNHIRFIQSVVSFKLCLKNHLIA